MKRIEAACNARELAAALEQFATGVETDPTGNDKVDATMGELRTMAAKELKSSVNEFLDQVIKEGVT
jgi:hypothetical protein